MLKIEDHVCTHAWTSMTWGFGLFLLVSDFECIIILYNFLISFSGILPRHQRMRPVGGVGGTLLGDQDENSEIYKHYAELCQIMSKACHLEVEELRCILFLALKICVRKRRCSIWVFAAPSRQLRVRTCGVLVYVTKATCNEGKGKQKQTPKE